MRQPARPKIMPKPKLRVKKPPKPDLPQHDHPAPYRKLFRLGSGEYPAIYDEVAEELKRGDVKVAAEALLKMTMDRTYYDYEDEVADFVESDPRAWTRQHALETLSRLGEAAQIGIVPLLGLLDTDDDDLQDAAPFYYATIGEPALEPLAKLLMDADAEPFTRAGAGSALAEMGEQHPELRSRIVTLLEQAMLVADNEQLTVGLLITNLMDLGAHESLPLIEQAYRDDRVDLSVVQMADIEEHFDLPRVTPWLKLSQESGFDDEDEDTKDWTEESALYPTTDDDEREVQVPYVAEVKAGRNDPCPCGSGKKYKKCCGA